MSDTATLQTAAHSLGHKENSCSERARSGYRPDPQTTLEKFNVATSDVCGQTDNGESGSEVSVPTGTKKKTRMKLRSMVVSDSDGGADGRGATIMRLCARNCLIDFMLLTLLKILCAFVMFSRFV